MEILEETVLQNFNFENFFFYRYVDDIITVCPENELNKFLDTFNSYDKNIQFTMEVEDNGRISFLDVLLLRNLDGSIKTDWYHKSVWSGRYLNFKSSLPINYKRNTVKILVDKIVKLSDTEFHGKNFELLENILIENCYPIKFIKQIIFSKLHSKPKPNLNYERVISDTRFTSIPYIKGLYEKLRKLFEHYNIKIVASANNTLKQNIFSKLKDNTPKFQLSNLVYQIKCECDAVYIGQTVQRLEKRLYNHKYNIKIKNQTHSALCEHAILSKHIPKFDETKILKVENNSKSLDILEMIEIQRNQNTLNKQIDSQFLSNMYENIIKK